jgi:alpha-tubulin suppressor-like RCC1 family protein
MNTGYCPATAVISSRNHTCARLADGGYMCWGNNQFGQLGNVSIDGGANSFAVPFSSTPPISSVGVGLDITCAIWAGDVYCFGNIDGGQTLGDAMNHGPTESGATAVACSSDGGCVLKDGGVECWGNYASGAAPIPTTPYFGQPVQQLAAGGDTFCGITADRTVHCFGASNSNGELGNDAGPSTGVQTVWGLNEAVQIAVGYQHACALVDGGFVWCWGDNFYGQSSGTNSPNQSPVHVLLSNLATSLGVGTTHSCAVDDNGQAWCWGENNAGQLGFDSFGAAQLVAQPSMFVDVTAITGGDGVTCALHSDGGIDCAGTNAYDELGSPSWDGGFTPQHILCP